MRVTYLAVLALASTATLASAEPVDRPAAQESTSLGTPRRGSLAGGIELRESPTIRRLGKHVGGRNFFGTVELVRMLERVAGDVAKRESPAPLQVGELSAPQGGPLPGHRSHHNGRDADLAFYVRDAEGRSARFFRFLAFGRLGPPISPWADRTLRFDDRRNWALVEALLTYPGARVQYLFVAREIRNRLLTEGWRARASAERLRAAAAVLVEPQRGDRHADHFHLRIFCAAADQPICQDEPPFWPWYEGTPPTATHAALPIVRWPALAAAALHR